MTSQVEIFSNPENLPCEHDNCDTRAARWLFPQTKHHSHGKVRSCSVHLARFVEATLCLAVVESIGVEIAPFHNPNELRCSHPKCDGRKSAWILPQTTYLPTGAFRSCSVHLPRFVEIALRYHALPAGNARTTT